MPGGCFSLLARQVESVLICCTPTPKRTLCRQPYKSISLPHPYPSSPRLSPEGFFLPGHKLQNISPNLLNQHSTRTGSRPYRKPITIKNRRQRHVMLIIQHSTQPQMMRHHHIKPSLKQRSLRQSAQQLHKSHPNPL